MGFEHKLLEGTLEPGRDIFLCRYACCGWVNVTRDLAEQMGAPQGCPPAECPRCSPAYPQYPPSVPKIAPIGRQRAAALSMLAGGGITMQEALESLLAAHHGGPCTCPSCQGSRERAANGPPPELPLVFDTKPVVGHRAFKLVDYKRRGGVSEPRLASLTGRMVWEPREALRATCLPRDGWYGADAPAHEAPWHGCGCGIWATRKKEHAAEEGVEAAATVYGELNLWGRVLEFKKGWRGELAYPKRLTVIDSVPNAGATAARLQDSYGIPVGVVETPAQLRSFSFTTTVQELEEIYSILGLAEVEQVEEVILNQLTGQVTSLTEIQLLNGRPRVGCANQNGHPPHDWVQNGVRCRCPGKFGRESFTKPPKPPTHKGAR